MFKKTLVTTVAILVICLFAIAPTAYCYNEYIHPLGRLRSTICLGDSLQEVKRKCDAYYDRRIEGNETLTYVIELPHAARGVKNNEHAGGSIYLYDESVFDDVQLRVYFDESGEVVDVLFIGD